MEHRWRHHMIGVHRIGRLDRSVGWCNALGDYSGAGPGYVQRRWLYVRPGHPLTDRAPHSVGESPSNGSATALPAEFVGLVLPPLTASGVPPALWSPGDCLIVIVRDSLGWPHHFKRRSLSRLAAAVMAAPILPPSDLLHLRCPGPIADSDLSPCCRASPMCDASQSWPG